MATSTKLKIGLVLDTTLDSTDGVPQYVTHLGRWLSAGGHEVHYLVGQSKRQDLPNIHSLAFNIKVKFNGNLVSIPLFVSRRKIKKFMKAHNFDVLHVQSPHHPLLAQRIIMAAGPQTAIVGTFHVLPYGKAAKLGNKLLGIWLRPSLKKIDRMLAVSDVAANFCERSFKIPAQVVPNMVDYSVYKSARPLKKYRSATLKILFLGRLVERKGCMDLLQAVALLNKMPDLPDFKVIICGRGQLEARLRQFVNDHNLSDKVEFAGFVSEASKPQYYAAADIAVFPSSSGESFGIVLLEAMAGGHAAVLAGNNPGYASVMAPRPELMFAPQNPAALAKKLQIYLTDKKRRQSAAAWGSAYAKDFDVAVVGKRLLDIYCQVLIKKRGQ